MVDTHSPETQRSGHNWTPAIVGGIVVVGIFFWSTVFWPAVSASPRSSGAPAAADPSHGPGWEATVTAGQAKLLTDQRTGAELREAAAAAKAQARAEAVDLLGAAGSMRTAGDLGIALELGRQAAAKAPDFAEAKQFVAEVEAQKKAAEAAAAAEARRQEQLRQDAEIKAQMGRLIDAHAWFNRPRRDFDARFGTPFEAKSVRPGSLPDLPAGGHSRGYRAPWGELYVSFPSDDPNARNVSLSLELIVPEQRPHSFDEALRNLNLLPGGGRIYQATPAVRQVYGIEGFDVGIGTGSVTDKDVWIINVHRAGAR